jgi:hypothetical protein
VIAVMDIVGIFRVGVRCVVNCNKLRFFQGNRIMKVNLASFYFMIPRCKRKAILIVDAIVRCLPLEIAGQQDVSPCHNHHSSNYNKNKSKNLHHFGVCQFFMSIPALSNNFNIAPPTY